MRKFSSSSNNAHATPDTAQAHTNTGIDRTKEGVITMYQPLENETTDLRLENDTTERLENETTGPPAAAPDKRDDRRDNQLKPDDGSSASSITATTAPHHPREKLKRLAAMIKLRTVLTIASLASLALAFAFISWLWWTPKEDPDDHWRRLILVPNRLQLSINIASLVIRTAIGIIAASAATMIASVAVERYGVRLHAVAPVSIARFASNGSLSLADLALQDSVSSFLLRITLLCLALTTIASQFTSTLLVADLERSHIISFPRQASGAYCPDPEAYISDPVINKQPRHYWLQKPRLSETYAEHTEPGLEVDGVDDTGLSIRALLPFVSPETREKLQVFQGTARVINSRNICVRPNVTDLRITYMGSKGDMGPRISGTVRIDDPTAVATLGVNPEFGYRVFRCALSLGSYDPRYVWQICSIGYVDWENVRNPLSNLTASATILFDAANLNIPFLKAPVGFYPHRYYEFPFADRNGLSFELDIHNSTKSGPWTQVTLDTNAYLDGMEQIARQGFFVTLNESLRERNFKESEVQEIKSKFEMGRLDDAERLLRQRISNASTAMWIKDTKETQQKLDLAFSMMKSKPEGDISLRMTVCVGFGSGGFNPVNVYSHLNHLEIFASSTEPRTEPKYVLASDREAYDVSVARKQLRAISTPTSTENRNILSIHPDNLLAGVRNDVDYRIRYNETDALLASWVSFSIGSPDTIIFRQSPSGVDAGSDNDPGPSHAVYSQLLHATINDTDSPARALQAVYFSKSRQVYHDFIDLMPPRDDCNYTITTFESAMVPGRRAGYWAVVGISGTFFICFLVIRFLFDSTKCSLPDNAWHTIAQVSESAEISAILSRSTTKTDKEVVEISRQLKDEDEDDRFVVRGGVFVRASMGSTADDSDIGPAGTTTTGLRRRLMARLRAPRDGTIEREP
ncbi:hypothetical protein CMUS01_08442 [Colletotrichum musicola]|uniref:Uncharacterized protein n=1 Tax=Colletotrichum musicola TaxID=2175873 RepID=A0A8H6KBZ0_9PEZI|nr:hypothetical protein CMUS01_08442 [Colletotrichum musicola]